MKIILELLIFVSITFAETKIMPKFLERDVKLKVVNVAEIDTLNLRNLPSIKGKILTKIPYNETNLKSLGKYKRKWIYVKYFDSTNKEYQGWIHSKFIRPINIYKTLTTKDFTFKYLYFIEAVVEQDDWIVLTNYIPYKHEQYQNGKDGEVYSESFKNFELSLKNYESFEQAMNDNSLLQDYDYSKNKYSEYSPIQKINNGFKVRLGHEGIGKYAFIISYQDSFFVLYLSYNMNKITSFEQHKKVDLLSYDEKIKIIESLVSSIEFF